MSRVVATVNLLPAELEEAIRRELRDGESLVWSGQPHPWLLARGALPIMFFGLFFGGFALFWVVGAAWAIWGAGGGPGGGQGSQPGNPIWLGLVFPLFGVPFLLVGLGMVLAPLGVKRAAQRTVYALTDRRVVIMKGKLFGGRDVRSYSADELGKMRRRERRSGAGDLIFQEEVSISHGRNGTRRHTTQHGFMAVSAVAELERLVRQTLNLD